MIALFHRGGYPLGERYHVSPSGADVSDEPDPGSHQQDQDGDVAHDFVVLKPKHERQGKDSRDDLQARIQGWKPAVIG